MTKEQEENIKILENLKTVIETGLVNFSGKSMYDCGYQEAIEHILSDLKNILSMLKEKDKMIDEIAEAINNHDIDEDICKQMGQKEDCNEFEDKEKCKYCIKQYFENKAKEVE